MCLAAFLQGMVFYGPVASLYRTQAGLSMGDIALIESVYYLLVVALELPLGAAAARLGYKRMLAVCSAVFFLSKLVFRVRHRLFVCGGRAKAGAARAGAVWRGGHGRAFGGHGGL